MVDIVGIREIIEKILRRNMIFSRLAAKGIYYFFPNKGKLEMEKVILAYLEEKQITSGKVKKMKIDMVFSRIYYQITPEEYFRYSFWMLSDYGRKQYIGEKEINRELVKIDDLESKNLLRDKYLCYKKFKRFYGREVILIKGQSDWGAFEKFCQEHAEIIAKPLKSSMGRDVRKILVNQEKVYDVFLELIKEGAELVIEEIINQAEEMARFHPQSVNSIRVVTCNRNGDIEIVQASVRMGVGSSIIDNGCLSAAVDIRTGIITSAARNAHNSGLHFFHPDTGEQIIGNQLPEWDKLITLVCQLSQEIPMQKVVGWDLAYSMKGWLMIEGNGHPAIQTLAGNGIGMRQVFEELLQ